MGNPDLWAEIFLYLYRSVIVILLAIFIIYQQVSVAEQIAPDHVQMPMIILKLFTQFREVLSVSASFWLR